MGRQLQHDDALIEAVGQRYRAGKHRQRREILDEFVRLTGYHRKHAIRVLATPVKPTPGRVYKRLYDEAVRQTLICPGPDLIRQAMPEEVGANS